MTAQQRPPRRGPASEHILQLFDTPESLGNVVSAFLNDGWENGEHLLVVAKPRSWKRTVDRLARRGWKEDDAVAEGRLTVLDAQATLPGIMRGQLPDPALFQETIGTLVSRLASATRRRLRVYGELVEILAEEGNFDGARHLEAFWNDLQLRHRFTLLHAALRLLCCTLLRPADRLSAPRDLRVPQPGAAPFLRSAGIVAVEW